jgi:hypothetical protein
VLEEELVGGAMELRLSPAIRPRLTIGRRRGHRIDPAGREVDARGFDLGVQLALGM